MEISRKEEDFKALSRVAPKVEIDDIYMISSHFTRDYNINDYEYVQINLSSSGELFSVNREDFKSKVELCLVASPQDDESEILRIECEYILYYLINSKKEIPESDLEVFCKINAIYNAWPYWREFVDNISNRANLPLPAIPLIKVKPIKPKKTTEQNKSGIAPDSKSNNRNNN